MADFKDELSPQLVARIAGDLSTPSTLSTQPSSFDAAEFTRLAVDGLDDLELKQRVTLIAQALAATMPSDPQDADRVIGAALQADGLHGWASMPVNEYVATALLDAPEVALPLLGALTSRYTAEFAVRPFIETHYDRTMEQLRTWATDPDEHLRRLVSEGTRPRLPWGGRLRCFIEDPTDTLGLLDTLHNDESLYVRRSVANHLNDISKDHPDIALSTARRWAATSTQGDYVVRHALRSLVKQGDPEALAILGFDYDAPVELTDLTCTPSTVEIGESVTVSFTLLASTDTKAAVDYVVHYQGARGLKAGKVFKLTVRDLPAGEPVQFSRKHAFRHVSIRTIVPGPHRIGIQVNGRVLGETEIEVR